ncbi:MAG: DUF192 domain-containing protein [Pseudomonadota bacterium]
MACAPGEVTVQSAETSHVFAVELADTPQTSSRGLMFRASMPREAGMLFLMDPPRQASFWMHNTMISLDLIFIDRAGVIESISPRAVPYSQKRLSSEGPVRAVLEINGGLADELGIGPGDRVIHPWFDEAPAEHLCPQAAE